MGVLCITRSGFESARCVFAAPRSVTQCQRANVCELAPDFQTCQVKIQQSVGSAIPSKSRCVALVTLLAFPPPSVPSTLVAQSARCCVFIRANLLMDSNSHFSRVTDVRLASRSARTAVSAQPSGFGSIHSQPPPASSADFCLRETFQSPPRAPATPPLLPSLAAVA